MIFLYNICSNLLCEQTHIFSPALFSLAFWLGRKYGSVCRVVQISLICIYLYLAMIQKYSSVLQRYFVQYLSGFDVAVLKEVVQKISVCSEDISLIMTSFIDTLSNISVKPGKSIVLLCNIYLTTASFIHHQRYHCQRPRQKLFL